MAKSLFYSGPRLSLLVFVARNENTSSDYFTSCRAGKTVPLLRVIEKPHDSSALVLSSRLCNMECLGIATLPGWDYSLSQVTPSFFQVALTTVSTPWRGEVLGESSVLSKNMTQRLQLGLYVGFIGPESN